MRTLPRDQIEELIKYLAETYPKTFFLQPHLKRPLKKNILLDLQKLCVLIDDDRREAAITFYVADWNYQETLVAGAKRVDLHGHEVGSVTMQEQLDAERKMKAQKDAAREKRMAGGIKGPIEVARKLHRVLGALELDHLGARLRFAGADVRPCLHEPRALLQGIQAPVGGFGLVADGVG